MLIHFGNGYPHGSDIITIIGIPSFRKRGRPLSYIIKNHVRLDTALFYYTKHEKFTYDLQDSFIHHVLCIYYGYNYGYIMY